MAEKLVKLKNAHVGHLSRALQSLEKELDEDPVNSSEVKRYLESVEVKFSKVEDDSEKILEELEEQVDINKEVESLDTLQDKVIGLKIRAKEALDKITEQKEDEKRRRLEAEREPTYPRREGHVSMPKLPELHIEKFNGDLEKYQEFIDSFTTTIDENPKLSNVDKFRYLRMFLEDQKEGDGPKSLIEGFATTDANYREALKLITETYGKKERIIMSHISKLLNLEVKEKLDKGSLRILYNKVQTHVRSLEVLQITSAQYSIFLVPIVLSKLTHNLRKEWGKYKKEDDIVELLEFIEWEIRSGEDARQVENAFSSEKEHVPRKKYNNESGYSTRVSSAAALNAITQVTKSCLFCPQTSDHFADQCQRAKSIPRAELKSILVREEACWCCFRKGHRKSNCRFLNRLSCEKCKRRHHTLLHEDVPAYESATTGCVASSDSKLRPIARGRLVGPTGKQVEVNIMLDPCSDESFVDKETSEALELQGYTIGLKVKGITGHVDGAKTRRVVHATVKHRHHLEKYKEIELVELPVIMDQLTRPAVKKEVLDSKFMKNLPLADDYEVARQDIDINVLIGLDYYYSVCSGKCRRAPDKPVLIDSLFGWVLLRDSENKDGPCSNIVCMLISTEEEKLISQQVKRFWEIEQISPQKNSLWSTNETRVFKEFKDSIEYIDNEYTVKLPMVQAEKEVKLDVKSNNRNLALNRFTKTMARFAKKPDIEEKYTKAVTDYINAGYAEKVEVEEAEDCWYIPHHIVLKEESLSTKVRLVMDGSASESGTCSINDQLEKGPTLQPLLNSVMLKHRTHRISLNADVEKMYLKIKVCLEDRNKLRFFWKNDETGELEVYRNCVLPFGLTCSPFLAVGTVQHHVLKYEDKHPRMVQELIESTYMDDMMTGADTEDEAISMYETSTEIMKGANMKLRKFTSNSPRLKERFRKDGVAAESMKVIRDDENDVYKLLGISYDSESDQFLFKAGKLISQASSYKNKVTKRSIMKVSPMLYDPLGWLNPFIVKIKIIIQELWERGIEWDEIVPSDIEKKWNQWIDDLAYLEDLRIPRRYNQTENALDKSRSELHIFGDASEVAYGAVVYYKTYDVEGNSEVSLMYCKSKVAPIKKVTLPRLELMAAVYVAVTSKYIKEAMKIPHVKTYLWTDSRITLSWIQGSSKQYKTYVANRVENIQELTEPSEWRWCPGLTNPADLPSRGVSLRELVNSTFWWKGPEWLNYSPENYPNIKSNEKFTDQLLEMKATVCLVQTSIPEKTPITLRLAGKLIDHMKVSKFTVLVRRTAYIARYLFNLMHKQEDRKYGPRCAPLHTEDVVQAELYWLQRIQEESFPNEVGSLIKNQRISNDSKLVKLSPYYDKSDGLVKMQGRVQFSDLTELEKHPIILPYNSYLVKLIIEDVHRKQLHSGINQTLIALRDRYWVLKARSLVRRIVKACILCRKYLPVRIQVPMAPIPRERLNRSNPFQVCGVDFTGPIYVSRGNKVEKSYIVLYTCAVIRAVHLELVENQTTEAFLRSFRRMISRRGMVSTFYSDNSQTFKSASREMKKYQKIMNGKAFRDFITQEKIEWKFIVDYAAWWGGFYERMMTTIKTPLKKVLGKSVFSADEIYTILTEVEAMVNSRPLTYISDEPSESSYLTPASFLIGREIVNIPVKPVDSTDKSQRKKDLNKLMIQQDRTLNLLWKTFREEYTRNLGTVPTNIKEDDCIKEKELVMVADHGLPKTKWKVGVVSKCKEGRDGRVRTVWIKTATGVYSRPVQHISRLELDSMEDYKEYTI